MVQVSPQPLSNIQMELLQLYSTGIPDEQLAELKDMIAKFLFDKATDEADAVWNKKQYNLDTINGWLNQD